MGPSFLPNVGTGSGDRCWLDILVVERDGNECIKALALGASRQIVTSGDISAGPPKGWTECNISCLTVVGHNKCSPFGSNVLIGSGDFDMTTPFKTQS